MAISRRSRCGVAPRGGTISASSCCWLHSNNPLLSTQGRFMNVLLLSMPDYFEHMPPVAVRMPNGALTSLAGNVDDHHHVAVADLILNHRRVPETVNRLIHEFAPDV